MKINLLRAGTLACALMTTTALTAPAWAQTGQSIQPGARMVDENGVNVTTGEFEFSLVEGTIGSGEGALSLIRYGTDLSPRSNWANHWVHEEGDNVTVTLADRSETFVKNSSGVYVPDQDQGATLTRIGGIFTYRDRLGTEVTFGTPPEASARLCAETWDGTDLALSIVRPNGHRVEFEWDVQSLCSGCDETWRLDRVRNSFGYDIDYTYSTSDFSQRTGATLTNMQVSGSTPLTVSYAYNSSTGAVEITEAGGGIWQIRPNSSSFGVIIRRPGSSSDNIVVTQDAGGNLISVVRDGVTTNYSRAAAWDAITVTRTHVDGDPETTDPQSSYVSDPISEIPFRYNDPSGRQTNWVFGDNGLLGSVRQPDGNGVRYTYDIRGNRTETRFYEKGDTGDTGDDIVTSATYPSSCSNPVTCNLPTTITDARGNVTDYEYDSTHGGVTRVTLPAPSSGAVRPQIRYSYGQVTAVTGQPVYQLTETSACQTQAGASGATPAACAGAADEVRTISTYDTINIRPTSVETRAGNGSLSATTAMTYSPYGDVLTVDGPLSGNADTTTFRYDAARRPVGTISPDPDGAGSLKRRATRTTYRADGQVSTVERGTVDGTGDGDWAAMTVFEGAQTEYDANNRPFVARLVSGSTTYALTQTGYDGLGRVRCVAQRMNAGEFATSSLPSDACVQDPQGSHPDRITRTSYDAAGQVTLVQTGYGVSGVQADEVATAYTNNGRISHVTDAEGNRTTYEYDMFDRPVKTRFPSPTTDGASSTSDYEQLTLDAAGNVTSRRLRDGQSIGYAYDALGRPVSVDMPNSATNPYEPDGTAFIYDNLGRLLQATDGNTNYAAFSYDALGRPLSEASFVHGTVTMHYDAAGRMTRMVYPGSGLEVGYAYNLLGEATEIRENPAGGNALLASFSYDDRGRRTGLTRGNGTSTSYAYDDVSRLTSLGQDLNGTTNDVTFGFSYNPASQIVSNTRSNNAYSFTGHANGAVSASINGLNQLTAQGGASVSHDARGNVTAIGSVGYGYNAANRLWYHPASDTALYYDQLGRLANVVGGGGYQLMIHAGARIVAEGSGWGGVLRRHVFGPGIDEPIVTYEGSGISDRRWLHADERGSVIAVSDSSGNLVGSINRYDEYGSPQGGAITGRFGYTGQAFLPELGLYYYKARLYNPALAGRFMQADPIGYEGGMNLYAYVLNDPVNLVDPSGLQQADPGVTVVGRGCGLFCRSYSNISDIIYNLPTINDIALPDIIVVGKRARLRTAQPIIRFPHHYRRVATICVAANSNCSESRIRALINSEICNLPGHTSNDPIDVRQTYWVWGLGGYVPGGRVAVSRSSNGLTYVNTTTPIHAFRGTVRRTYYQVASGDWMVETVGRGVSDVAIADMANQVMGPGIFATVDANCRFYVENASGGGW